MVTLIWAETLTGAIGKDNQLLVKSKKDMNFFKQSTQDKVVVQGRKTFESIGKPLPNRQNIILTRDTDYKQPNCLIMNSVDEVLEYAKDKDVYVIGGSEIYELFLPYADRLLRTIFLQDIDGDTYAPVFDRRQFTIKSFKKEIEQINDLEDLEIHLYEYVRLD